MIINGKRALAYTARVTNIVPIDGADNIELAHVKGWTLVVKKNEFKEGDLGVYFEIDSKLPDEPWSEFLKNKDFKVKTMKLNKFKVVSQGLLLPITSLPLEFVVDDEHIDLTDQLKVKHIEDDYVPYKLTNKESKDRWDKLIGVYHPKLVKSWFFKKFKDTKLIRILFPVPSPKDDRFPSEISKTDEERIENLPELLWSTGWIVTEKLDGTSATYLLRKGKKENEFIVCSRNRRIHEPEDTYWAMAEKYHIKEFLELLLLKGDDWVCVQGEIIGPSINGNRLKQTEKSFHAFNFITSREGRLNSIRASYELSDAEFEWVPILQESHTLPKTMEEMKAEAEGNSVVNPDCKREGLVYRNLEGKSFKNVSNTYLLKKG